MIQRLLVANRGEIARRVIATCRQLGIETVVVHSDVDTGMPFVREADVAVRLPGNTPGETYLRADLVLEAARHTGADAIHPGYGFLSENAAFARSVIEAGLTWVGPSPDAIEAMGSKVRAKELMRGAGVPVLEAPGSRPDSTDGITEADLPLLVKASAGGGGRGMRVVRVLADLAEETAKAAAEAESAFGDPTVFVEPYVEQGRHVEVQVVGDTHGDVLVLGERDCSVQRRHQKVVEESPAPDLDPVVAEAMHTAARKAAEAIGYVGAGTVEFLLDPATDRFFFLEMNTRLQVEHPVTEATVLIEGGGVDLVELQLQVAEGRALPPGPVETRGHAIEVRLYAEDPAADWQPQSGLLTMFEIPHAEEFRQSSHGIRLDSGFESGNEVSTHYDAMLAKVIAWAPSRREAARMLVSALRRARLHGVTTNRDQLVGILTDPAFVDMTVSTSWLAPETGQRLGPSRIAVVAGALMLAADDASRRTVQSGVPTAWRNVTSQPQRTSFEGHDPVEWWGSRDGLVAEGVTVLSVSPTHAHLEVDGVASQTRGHKYAPGPGSPREIWVDGPLGSARLRENPRFVDPADVLASGSLVAPMPGSVVAVEVEDGESVVAGSTMLVLEAMKMQHTISAPADGVVSDLVRVGAQVAAGDVLAVVSTSSISEHEESA